MKRDNYFPQGPAFDGSFGVDTEDIISIPCIDFGTLYALSPCLLIGFQGLILHESSQLFPDHVRYYPVTPSNQTIAKIGEGNAWTDQHSFMAQVYVRMISISLFALSDTIFYSLNKPEVLTGYQIVSQAELSSFVPFTASCPTPGGPPGGLSPSHRNLLFITDHPNQLPVLQRTSSLSLLHLLSPVQSHSSFLIPFLTLMYSCLQLVHRRRARIWGKLLMMFLLIIQSIYTCGCRQFQLT
jgi:hypothetical protein